MRTIRLLLPAGLLVLMMTLQTVAQSPQAFSYQAVVRNDAGEIIANQDILVRLSLTDGQGKGNGYHCRCIVSGKLCDKFFCGRLSAAGSLHQVQNFGYR